MDFLMIIIMTMLMMVVWWFVWHAYDGAQLLKKFTGSRDSQQKG